MDDGEHDDFQDSGPFCQHWGDPVDCETPCPHCGHTCVQHRGQPDSACTVDGCECEGFQEAVTQAEG